MIGGVIAEANPQRSMVERAIAGDEVAFARIVAAHHDDMARIAFFVCGDLDIAEEAEQSAWAVAYRRLKDLRDPDRLRPWLRLILLDLTGERTMSAAICDVEPSQPSPFAEQVAEVMPIIESFEFHPPKP